MNTIESLEIVRYKFERVDNEPKIIIEMVKALDENGKYIKFLSMKDVEPLLPKLPVTFRNKGL